MKNTGLLILLTVFGFFFITSCEKEDLDMNESYVQNYKGNKDQKKSKKPKVEICHFDKETQSYVKLSISENGLNGHANHTDDIINFDKDGDGFPVMNECGINFRDDGLFDCDDENAQKFPMDMDEDGFTACDDCNDNDASINPNTVWYADNDGDEYGDPNTSVTSCEQPDGYGRDNTDCDDTDAALNPTQDNEGYSTCDPKPEEENFDSFDFKSLHGNYVAYNKELNLSVNFNININYFMNTYFGSISAQYTIIENGNISISEYMVHSSFQIDKVNGVIKIGSYFPYTNMLFANSTAQISLVNGITYLDTPSTYYHDGFKFEVTKQ